VVVVDTLDCLGIEDFRGDINQRTEELGRILPGIARRCNTVFIIVHHISKEAAKQLRLTVHSGKGGSSVEQKADIAIGLNKHGDHMLLMESLKGRDVKPFSVSVEQNLDTATFLRHTMPFLTLFRHGSQASMLEVHPSLTTLTLGNNIIGSLGAADIAVCIRPSP
jgi:hypothetical protein